MPVGWDNLNALTASASLFTCNKGIPGNPGASHMQLASKNIPGRGIVPGVATCGILDTATLQCKSGFAYASRPLYLAGSWIYMAFGADKGRIFVLLSKWSSSNNKRDTVAFTDYHLPGMVMAWAPFFLPLTYQSAEIPDSAIIFLASSGSFPAEGSFLQVDDLRFTNDTTIDTTTATLALRRFLLHLPCIPIPQIEM